MTYISPLLNFLTKSTRQIGKTLVRDFMEIEKLQNSLKNQSNFINITKKKVEKKIFDNLKKVKKDLEVKSLNTEDSNDCWIVEIIDNTLNFSRGISDFCILIALKQKKEIYAAVIYNPIQDDIFFFEKGVGGYNNDLRIRINQRNDITESILFGIYNKHNSVDDAKTINIIRNIFTLQKFNLRESGSLFLDICNVGSGRYDGCMMLNPSNNSLLINKLIMQETGGGVFQTTKSNSEIYFFCNKFLGNFLKEIIDNSNEKK